MFGEINRRFNRAKKNAKENAFIIESVLDVEEVLPGSEDEFDDEIDVDSVPDEVYKEIDKKLDELISKGDYDDEEIEEMVDDDDDDDEDFDIRIEEVIDEAVSRWDINEEVSYGSGEKVDVENKTGDEVDGDKTNTEIPEPDCPVKAEKEVEKGEELYDFSDDNKKPSDYKEGDQVKTEEADFESTEEAKKAMSENSLSFYRSLIEDASYGSGEAVEVENKTNDVVDGDKTKVEEPDFETTAEAKQDLAKDEAEYDKYREGSDGSEANLGMKNGDHVEMETKNPITNESALTIYRSLIEGAITPDEAITAIDEGAITEKWRANFSPEMKKLKASVNKLKQASRRGDDKKVSEAKKEAKESLKKMRDIVDDIPDDSVGSWLSRIFLTTLPEFIIGLSNADKGEGIAQACASYFGGYLGKIIKAAIQGDGLGEISRNDMHRILDAVETEINNY